MQIKQEFNQTQKLKLTPTVRQSLQYLQLPIQELGAALEEISMRNPMLEVELPSMDMPYPQPSEPERETDEVYVKETLFKTAANFSGNDIDALSNVCAEGKSLSEHLIEQLLQMTEIDERQRALCRFIVGCLNSAGYLDSPIEELAALSGVSVFELEQALYAVQTLDPPGVGARDLSECLLIQLAQGSRFNAANVALIRRGLPLLAENDTNALRKLLGVSGRELETAIDDIKSLNPIPSRGFGKPEDVTYVVPEATVYYESGRLTVEMNSAEVPRVSLRKDYCDMLSSDECSEAHEYLKKQLSEAKGVLHGLKEREKTLRRIVLSVIMHQKGYFSHGEDIKPLTMGEVADELDINVSTVSRGVNEKYILFEGKVLPLRTFFASGLSLGSGDAVSPSAIKRKIKDFVSNEDKRHPLSDEALRKMFENLGISLSRRVIAKYRGEINIPSTSQRRVR